ncbi:unnamed protein product [Durusdinium trenchii]|uniref:Uncharacterized protein n=1 Tax=Durusdinium trenchii TaxID=1381693 RepID=A0ABP0IGK0_9DINO
MNQPSVPQGLFAPGGVSPPQPRPRQRLPPRRRTAVRVAPVGADEAPTFCLEEQVAPSELPRQGCLFKAPKGSWDVEPDLIRSLLASPERPPRSTWSTRSASHRHGELDTKSDAASEEERPLHEGHEERAQIVHSDEFARSAAREHGSVIKEEDMLEQLQNLANSFRPDSSPSDSSASAPGERLDEVSGPSLGHPSKSVEAFGSGGQDVQSDVSGGPDRQAQDRPLVFQDPAARRRSSSSQSTSPRPSVVHYGAHTVQSGISSVLLQARPVSQSRPSSASSAPKPSTDHSDPPVDAHVDVRAVKGRNAVFHHPSARRSGGSGSPTESIDEGTLDALPLDIPGASVQGHKDTEGLSEAPKGASPAPSVIDYEANRIQSSISSVLSQFRQAGFQDGAARRASKSTSPRPSVDGSHPQSDVLGTPGGRQTVFQDPKAAQTSTASTSRPNEALHGALPQSDVLGAPAGPVSVVHPQAQAMVPDVKLHSEDSSSDSLESEEEDEEDEEDEEEAEEEDEEESEEEKYEKYDME